MSKPGMSIPMSNEDQVRSTYAALSDDQLIKIATKEADDLTDLGYEILTEEISKRGLFGGDIALDDSPPDDDEIDYFIDILETLPCPGCGSRNSYLKSRVTREVISAVVFTTSNECLIIGCEECIEKWDRFNRRKTYLLGWWGFPGIIRTAQALSQNLRSAKSRNRESDSGFEHFVIENIGYLRAYKEDNQKLIKLLKAQNERR